MSETRIVSFRKSSGVSSENAEIISAKQGKKARRRSSPGLYLIKTGSAYMFQMRLPKEIAPDCKRPIRIGLGVIPKAEARRIADQLAAIARQKFKQIGIAMDAGEETEFWPLMEDMLGFAERDASTEVDSSQRALLAVTMLLKSALYDIRGSVPSPTPEQEGNFAMMRGLVRIGQEKARKDAGQDYDKQLGDNAELLAERLVDRFQNDPASALTQPSDNSPRTKGKISARSGLINSKVENEADKDRRYVQRDPSTKPKFSEAASAYLAQRVTDMGEASKDIGTAETRLTLFIDLIGDHPIDRYTPTDLQAFINLIKFWPPKEKHRPPNLSAMDIIDSNRDYSKGRLAKSTMQNGYMGVIKPVFSDAAPRYDFDNPVKKVALKYPKTSRDTISAEPLSSKKMTQLFRTCVQSPYIDDVMLPPLGFLTSRRLGLLTHLVGTDIKEKFEGVWVAEVSGIVTVGEGWVRRPIKTTESARYFVLHNFLVEIGYVEWARNQGEKFLFPQLMNLVDPSKTASPNTAPRLVLQARAATNSRANGSISSAEINITQAVEEKEDRGAGKADAACMDITAVTGRDHNKYGGNSHRIGGQELFCELAG